VVGEFQHLSLKPADGVCRAVLSFNQFFDSGFEALEAFFGTLLGLGQGTYLFGQSLDGSFEARQAFLDVLEAFLDVLEAFLDVLEAFLGTPVSLNQVPDCLWQS
jgi:hypothetical protein